MTGLEKIEAPREGKATALEQTAGLTPRGMNAMRGLAEGDSAGAVGGTAEAAPPEQVEALALQERYRLGVDYAAEHAEVQQRGLVGYRKVSGAVGEGVYLSANGGSIGLVNDLNERLGNHCKLFDGCSPQEMASIKTYVTGREDPSGRYTHALREMVGQVEPQKLDGLAQELWDIRQQEPERWAAMRDQLPPSLAQAEDVASMRSRLVDDAVMRIPADHVEGARAHVLRNAVKRPELYGIDASLSKEQIEGQAVMLANKIRPLAPDVNGHDLRVMAGHAYRKRFGN